MYKIILFHLSINGIAMPIKCEYWSAPDDVETISFVILGKRIAMSTERHAWSQWKGLELQLRGPMAEPQDASSKCARAWHTYRWDIDVRDHMRTMWSRFVGSPRKYICFGLEVHQLQLDCSRVGWAHG